MDTLILSQPGTLTFAQTEEPLLPGQEEALVRVHRIGVCGTDIHAFGGRQPFFSYPRILGHELGVEVLEVGSGVSSVQPGDRCSVEPYLSCNTCIACRRGKPNCCASLKVLGVHVDGGMRERLLLPVSKLHCSTTLSYDQLALVETLGIGCHAVERAAVEAGENVLVIGAGPIGLSVIQFALAKQARVIVLDVSEARLDFCSRELGVSATIQGRETDPMDKLRELTEGELPTVVFDATGNPTSMRNAFNYPAHGGRLVFVGLFQGDLQFSDPEFHRRELTVLASRNALAVDFKRIMLLVESGLVNTSPWITHRASLKAAAEVFAGWTNPAHAVIKAVIEL